MYLPMTTPPLIVADGLGVDSTAVLCELRRRKIRPDAILFANVGNEKDETYAYLDVRRRWLQEVGFPELVIVQYQVTDFKNWPPYHSLGENCLTNGTLPSLAFGFKSCSLKWKVTPQNRWTESWQPAIDCWAGGQKVRKIIGYDASPKDMKRYAVAVGVEDPAYDYWYPLMDWKMDRDACKESIRRDLRLRRIAEELGQNPIPPKSACIFCPSTKPEELRAFKRKYLRYIVIMEARAMPRLTKVKGLWRKAVKGLRDPSKKKPASMTEFIRDEGLLPAEEIEKLIQSAPQEIIHNQQEFANGMEIPDWHDFLEMFTPEDEADGCEGCSCGPDVVMIQLDRKKGIA